MFGTSTRRTRHHHTTTTTAPRTHRRGMFHWGRPSPNRRAGGLKAALHNPNTTSAGRREAKHELRAMGRGREAHVPISVRIKHFLGIKNHHHRRRY